MIRTAALAALAATIARTDASAQVRVVVSPVVRVAVRPVIYRPVAPPVHVVRHVTNAPRVVFVHWVPRRGAGWWKRNGFRKATVYSDGRNYYSAPIGGVNVMRVTVYERRGYYVME